MIKYAATFHREVDDLVDMEEVMEEMKQKPEVPFRLKRKKNVLSTELSRPAVCKKFDNCLRCSRRSIHGKFLGVL